MDSCGSPMRGSQGLSSMDSISETGRSSPVLLLARMLVVFLLLGFLGGCATSLRYGSPPRVDRLGALKPGDSTTADVLLMLGEPRGRGATQFSPGLPPGRIWFYEYQEGDGKTFRLKILLVFFDRDKDLYAGHLWFSAASLLNRTE